MELDLTNPTMHFISSQFDPPRSAALCGFSIAVLSPQYAEQDFAAVSASANSIRHVFGPENDWPAAQVTFEENRLDLLRHELEFHDRSAFAYAVLDTTGRQYLGCLYLRPIKPKHDNDERKKRFDAQAFLWLSVLHAEVAESSVQEQIDEWFRTVWRFKAVAWPGRNPTWLAWSALAGRPSALKPRA